MSIHVIDDREADRVAAQMWFTSLWEEYAGAIYAYALRRVPQSSAEDVVADTFLVAWRRRSDCPDTALPWLYAVAGNVVRQRYRADTRWRKLLERAENESVVGGVVSDHEALTEFRAALSTLPWEDQEILLLTGWEGLNRRELAQVLAIDPAAARMRLTRARRRLREALRAQDRE